jgi:hypothetical protein
MTLDSAIKYKDFSNPSIVRVRPINIQMGADGKTEGVAGPKGAVQLKLTKPLTIINAQGKNEIIAVGGVVWGIPLQTIAANNSYLYETQGRTYVLTVGVNATLYNPSSKEDNSEQPKKGFPVSVIGFGLIAIVIIYTMNKL